MGAATAEGRFELLPLTAFYPWQGQDVVVDRALDEGPGGAAVCGGSRDRADPAGLPGHRAEHGSAMPDPPGVGAMPVRALDDRGAGVGRGRCDAHPRGVRELMFDSTASPAGLVLHGEIDVDNADVLAAVLGAALAPAVVRTRRAAARPRRVGVPRRRRMSSHRRYEQGVPGDWSAAAPRRPTPLVAWVMGLVGLYRAGWRWLGARGDRGARGGGGTCTTRCSTTPRSRPGGRGRTVPPRLAGFAGDLPVLVCSDRNNALLTEGAPRRGRGRCSNRQHLHRVVDAADLPPLPRLVRAQRRRGTHRVRLIGEVDFGRCHVGRMTRFEAIAVSRVRALSTRPACAPTTPAPCPHRS